MGKEEDKSVSPELRVEREKQKRVLTIQENLGISFKEALIVDSIAASKGLQNKLAIESSDEEMELSPSHSKVIDKAKDHLDTLDKEARVFIPNHLDPSSDIEK